LPLISALSGVPVLKNSECKAEASEKDAILKRLDKVDWNKPKAARTLGMAAQPLQQTEALWD